jgi:hypothetical protein
MKKSLLLMLGGAIIISSFAFESNTGLAANFSPIDKSASAVNSLEGSVKVKTDITGIRTLQLEEDDLEALGIRVANGNIYQSLSNGGYVCYSKTGTSFPQISKENNRSTRNYLKPVLVTDDQGNWRSFKCQDLNADQLQIENNVCIDEVALSKRLTSLVPVLVKSGQEYTMKDKILGNWRPDVIFWYEHNNAFLDAIQNEW